MHVLSTLIDLLPFLIFLILAVGGPILKAAKNARGEQAARQEALDKRLRGEGPSTSDPSMESSSRRARADQQMAKRQAQLEVGRQSQESDRTPRQLADPPRSSQASSGDKPLTMAERIQLARQAQLQQRQGGSAPVARSSSTPSRSGSASRAPGQRAPTAPRRPSRVNPVQPNQPRPTRTNPVPSRGAPAVAQASRQTRPGTRGVATDARRRREAAASRPKPAAAKPVAAAPARTGSRRSDASLENLNLRDLRHANPDALKKILAMKIILDVPVALRDEEIPLNVPL